MNNKFEVISKPTKVTIYFISFYNKSFPLFQLLFFDFNTIIQFELNIIFNIVVYIICYE